jgi:hypothetical protein
MEMTVSRVPASPTGGNPDIPGNVKDNCCRDSYLAECHIPYIHASRPDFGIQIWSGPTLRSASDPIYDKLPKFISCSFNIIAAYSFIR